jgi:hypothetical protein
MKLGTLLLRNDVISLSQLETALRTQVLYGGRLGTNLVELGYLDLATLAEYLARIMEVPMAAQEMFESVSEHVINDFGAVLARRYEAFPLGYLADQPNSLAVAMVDPHDRELVDKLSEELGGAVSPHAAPELRIYYYMEKHFGIVRKARFVRVGTPGSTPGHGPERRRTQPVRGMALPPSMGLELRPSPTGTAPDAERASASAEDPAGDDAAAPVNYREACAAIDGAEHREAIGDTMIDYARGRYGACVIFLLRDGNALGWRMYNSDPDRADYPIEELSLPLGGISALQAAYDSRQIYRGRAPSPGKPVERALWEALGTSPEPREMLVVPVVVKQRVVNLIYAHAIGGGRIDDIALKKLGELAKRTSHAYRRLIQQARNSAQD